MCLINCNLSYWYLTASLWYFILGYLFIIKVGGKSYKIMQTFQFMKFKIFNLLIVQISSMIFLYLISPYLILLYSISFHLIYCNWSLDTRYFNTLSHNTWTAQPPHPPPGVRRPALLGEWVGQGCPGGGGRLPAGPQGGKLSLPPLAWLQVDVPVLEHGQCQAALRSTRLGPDFLLDPVARLPWLSILGVTRASSVLGVRRVRTPARETEEVPWCVRWV